MRKMHPMPRQTPRASSTARVLVGLVTLGVLALVGGGTASAQATAPPSASPPSLEAGDTTPPTGAPAAAPIEPVAPLDPASPLVAAPPTTVSAPLVVPVPPAPRREPIYRKDWFWGAVGVLVLTGAIVLSLSLSSADPTTPNTKLGDMRAF
jgi:hypothetical protein